MNKAYEFLCSKDSRKVQGPDPHNIVLILKAQSILFKRYKEGTKEIAVTFIISLSTVALRSYFQSVKVGDSSVVPVIILFPHASSSNRCWHTVYET